MTKPCVSIKFEILLTLVGKMPCPKSDNFVKCVTKN